MGATASGQGWTCASRIPSALREAAAAATLAAAASTPPSPRTPRGASGPPFRYRRARPVSFVPTDAQNRVSCVVLCAGAQVLAGVVVRGEAAIPERGRGGELVLGFGVERHIRVQPLVDALPGLLLLPALPAAPATGTPPSLFLFIC